MSDQASISGSRVRVAKGDSLARIRIGSPDDSVNPLNTELLDQLDQAIATLARDASVRCAILTGHGPAFAAGADLNQVIGSTIDENLAYGDRLRNSFDAIEACPFPIVAAINGHALGGGLELALACTLRIAAAGVALALPEVRLGLLPSAGGVQRIAREVVPQVALDLLLTGRTIRAEEAAEKGLLCAVVPPESLDDAAGEIATRIAANSPAAVSAVAGAYRAGREVSLDRAQNLTRQASADLLRTEEWREGITAFLERRRPTYAPPI